MVSDKGKKLQMKKCHVSTDYQNIIKKIEREQDTIKKNFEELLVSKIAERSVLIWGAVKRNDFFLKFCKKNRIEIIGYIDSYTSGSSFNGYPIWKPDDIKPNQNYLFIGLNKIYYDILDKLNEWGKKPHEDYLYWSQNNSIITYCNGFYNDCFGNQIVGDVTGFSVCLSRLSNLRIGKHCIIDESVKIDLGENAILEIGDNCIIGHSTIISVVNNSFLHIGNNSSLRPYGTIRCNGSSKVYISDNVQFGNYFRLASNRGGILINNDCIFSTNIVLQGADGHPLYDLEQHRIICKEDEYQIEIGEHVWIGRCSSIRYGAQIGAGTVIGMGSFVNKEVPCNVIAAGNPLKIIRKNIAWDRKKHPGQDDFFEKYDFR